MLAAVLLVCDTFGTVKIVGSKVGVFMLETASVFTEEVGCTLTMCLQLLTFSPLYASIYR